jgi:agmatinase
MNVFKSVVVSLAIHSSFLGGYSDAHVLPPPQGHQVVLQSQPVSFRDTSIFRTPDVDVESAHKPQWNPGFHMYDNFGKDTPMPGIATFAHLNWTNCMAAESDGLFDVGIVGMPFDLGVSYRPGQRFGPAAARMTSQRMAPFISYSMAHNMINPFRDWATVVDCGDIPNSLFDKYEAVQELGHGIRAMSSRLPKTAQQGEKVRLVTIGGDHTISEYPDPSS